MIGRIVGATFWAAVTALFWTMATPVIGAYFVGQWVRA